jgi:hypothetical protein
MNIAFSDFDNLHLIGESATHPIRPPSGALATLQILAIPPGIAVVCAIASALDDDLLGHVQLPFLG